MPSKNDTAQPAGSPFEIVTSGKSKKTGKKGVVIAVLIVVFLILSVVAGILLVQQRQNIQEKAAVNLCPAAEACPLASQPNLLRNCHPPESDGTPAESLCTTKGRVEFCGAQNYCCPGANQAWTTNMAACASPSPTASPTASPTSSPTGSATATPTGSASPTGTPATTTPTPTAVGTPMPIPETGIDWPTYAGFGLGALVIIASILIAL